MLRPDLILEIIATYEKHGWVLRRVLFCDGGCEGVDVETIKSDIDAAWFSRPPKSGPVAWEIRYLGEPPFSLVEHIDESEPDFEAQLKTVESKLKEKIATRRISLDNGGGR